MAFRIMSSPATGSNDDTPWVEEWTETCPETGLFPRQVKEVKEVKSGKGFLLDCGVFLCFVFKKDPRAVFIDQYLVGFGLKEEAPSLKVLPNRDEPKQWHIGIDDDLAVRHVTLNDWTTSLQVIMVESPITGKLAPKAHTPPPDSLLNQTGSEPETEPPAKRPRKSAKNAPKTDETA